ncbi:MAG: hypothetical protein Q4F67_17670, partial [Propionibacteriaceae bacterium]|nr:hypothetical protein [Propionibacteriaceae bacterium]
MFALLPVLVLLISAAAAVAIMLLPERARTPRAAINVSAAVLKLALLVALIPVVFFAEYPAVGWEFLPGVRLELRIDSLSMVFALLSSVLWLATTIYAIGYLRDTAGQSRFFG